MSNQSPVLSCNIGVYMFPDIMSQMPGSYVGVVLSSELPAADRELFDDLLKQMSELRVQVTTRIIQFRGVTLNNAQVSRGNSGELLSSLDHLVHGVKKMNFSKTVLFRM